MKIIDIIGQSAELLGLTDVKETLNSVTVENEGDCFAKDIYKECGIALGKGLSILIDILNPERIVIGSIYQRAENLLASYAEEEIRRNALKLSASVCKVVPAKLENSIGDYAAISLVSETI